MAPELLERGIEELRTHMFVEEELVFPVVGDGFAPVLALLAADHGRLSGLAEGLQEAFHRGDAPERLRLGVERLLGLLAAHGAAEDLGLYAELPLIIGEPRLVELLAASERAAAPADWVCLARQGPSSAPAEGRRGSA